jgi:hypothetical protein
MADGNTDEKRRVTVVVAVAAIVQLAQEVLHGCAECATLWYDRLSML